MLELCLIVMVDDMCKHDRTGNLKSNALNMIAHDCC